jgi:hypothetical protein
VHRETLAWRPTDGGTYEAVWYPETGLVGEGEELFVLEPRLWRYRIHQTGVHRPTRLAWIVFDGDADGAETGQTHGRTLSEPHSESPRRNGRDRVCSVPLPHLYDA